MRVLVTGGSGFIGTRLVGALLEAGNEVRIFDLRPSPRFDDLVVRGDVRHFDQLASAVKGMHMVYHLAAEHRDDVRPSSLYHDVNVGGAENLARAAEAAGVPRLVFTSTVAVYGLDEGEAAEDTPTAPFNDYGRSKLSAEHALISWANADSARSVTVVRPTVVFGEGNHGNVYNLMRQIAKGRFVMVGTGTNRKSVCYVGNLVAFLLRLLDGEAGARIMNYADKPDLTMHEFVALVREELGANHRPLPRVPYWAGLLSGYAFDALSAVTGRRYPVSSIRIRKFCSSTAIAMQSPGVRFDPPYTLHEGLRRMVQSLEL